MTNKINVGQTLPVSVTWFDAVPTDPPVVPTATTTWVSGTPSDLSIVSTGKLSASITGINPNAGVVITATEPGTGATATSTIVVAAVGALGAATQLNPLEGTISTLETGDVGIQLTAWGGSEYGYAYTFALSGAPAGVTIDADMGRLSVASTLTSGDKTFTVIVANRENGSLIADFTFTLHVLTGVTSGTPTTSQIRHATFDPASGTWGNPSGNDWTAVFNSMHTDIISLQNTCNAVHDESLRVTVPLQRGTTYNYTNNLWMNGIQYLNIVDAGGGALPILQCTSTSGSTQVSGAMNQTPSAGAGQGPGAMSHQGTVKAHCAPIQTVSAGSTSLTLLSSGDASKIVVGRWHTVCGSVVQFQSYPPSVQYIDYVKVTAVSGTTVTIDRPLKYDYSQNWWETNSTIYGDFILGVARLVPYDTGGTGGYIPADPRCGIRNIFTNLNFVANPNATGQVPPGNTVGAGCDIDVSFVGCQIPNLQITMSKHVVLKNTTVTWLWELDKQTETCLLDGVVGTGEVITGATGYQYLLFRNSTIGLLQISPRQLRAINTSFDGTGDGSIPGAGGAIGPPVTFGYLGSLQYYDFGSVAPCTFTKGTSNVWAPAYNSANNSAAVTLGTTASWKTNQLQIPAPTLTSGDYFERWMGWAVPGAIVSVNPAAPFTTNWGYVATATSPGDGTVLCVDIVWVNGTKPTTGTIYILQGRRLFFAQGNTFTAGTNWASPGWAKETAVGRETGWNFPTGYPASLPPFPAFDIKANFNAVPAGAFTQAAKLIAWGNMPSSAIYANQTPSAISLFDGDPTGTYSSILAAGGVTGGNCIRMKYPAGVAGEGTKYYQIQCGPVGIPVNVEFDILFETGFDFATSTETKFAPLVVWGGRSGASGGAAQFTIANYSSGSPKFSPILQNQQSPTSFPAEFISPVFNTSALSTNTWYHWKYRLLAGPNGFCQHYLNSSLLGTVVTTFGNTTQNDSVIYEFGWWSGGTVGPATDSFARMDNIHIYTG